MTTTMDDNSVTFSSEQIQMLDHYLAEIEALKDLASGNYLISNDAKELSDFLDERV